MCRAVATCPLPYESRHLHRSRRGRHRLPLLLLSLILASAITFPSAASFAQGGEPAKGGSPADTSAVTPATLLPGLSANQAPSQSPLEYWDKAIGVADKLAKILALIIGGLFAYMKFFMGRTFRPRLESAITGELIEKDGVRHLAAKVTVKNIGLTKCGIRQEGSGIRIWSYSEATRTNLGAESILEHHKWIESSETVTDEILISLNGDKGVAYQLELWLVSQEKTWLVKKGFPWRTRGRVVWVTRGVVSAVPPKE